MFGSTVLEVAIGLSVVYLTFSVLCSSIREGIARWIEERQTGLLQGLHNFFGNTSKQSGFAKTVSESRDRVRAIKAAAKAVNKETKPSEHEDGSLIDKVLASPVLAGLARKRGEAPSHIPPREFAAALLDALVPGGSADRTLGAFEKAVKDIGDDNLNRVLLPIIKDAGDDLDKLRAGIEARYQNVMMNISAWYRRHSQIWMVIIAVVVSGVANVDTIEISNSLYRDPAVRELTVARAAKTTSAALETGDAKPGDARLDDAKRGDAKPGDATPGAAYNAAVAEMKSLRLPIGWQSVSWPKENEAPGWIFWKVVGIVLTALALLLGGPFWFDVLTRASALRTAAIGFRETLESPPKPQPKTAS